jgi:carbonic anhydrase
MLSRGESVIFSDERHMMRHFLILAIGLLLLLATTLPATSHQAKTTVTSDLALAELKAGNLHHVRHQYKHPHETVARQRELVDGQNPHAEILSCADSRVPPEIVFDQGLGDLFVVRVAGNVATDTEIGSLEYGAEHLHIPLLVVLGHESCGAVTAAVQGGEAEGHIAALVSLIKPAVDKSRGLPGDPVANSVRTNVQMVVQQLRSSTPVLSELVAHGKLKIVGGIYSLKSGEVTWLPD